jgi:hypothetical protein
MTDNMVYQTNLVFDVLKERMPMEKGITSMEAIEMFGATRLSAIIFALRKRLANTEYDIISEWHTGISRYNRTTRYVEYILVKRVI